jgi:hypothetical protein
MQTTGKDTDFKLDFPFTTVDVRFRSITTTKQQDIDWLLETVEFIQFNASNEYKMAIGLDTEFDNQEVSLIQIATRKRVLLIYAIKNDRVKSPEICKPLADFIADSNILMFGAELWYDGKLFCS